MATAEALRETLARSRLMLIFTPSLCGERDPLEVLEAVLPSIDVIQVRPKEGSEPSPARETHDWCLRVLDLVDARRPGDVLVLVNDRVDVAAALADRGCAGCHLGQEDCPPEVARGVLGARALLGLSTRGAVQLSLAVQEPVDYVGFGPVFPTETKGYDSGLGPEAAWVADTAAGCPLFPIGGIDATNAFELTPVGRAAVGGAILGADRPGRAARELREMLSEGKGSPYS